MILIPGYNREAMILIPGYSREGMIFSCKTASMLI